MHLVHFQGKACLDMFSSAVFEENVEVLSYPCRRRRCLHRRHRSKSLTFSNLSVITEDIYLKLKLPVLSKGEPILVGEVILLFFYIFMPLFRLRIF